jgi:hypothetical protein
MKFPAIYDLPRLRLTCDFLRTPYPHTTLSESACRGVPSTPLLCLLLFPSRLPRRFSKTLRSSKYGRPPGHGRGLDWKIRRRRYDSDASQFSELGGDLAAIVAGLTPAAHQALDEPLDGPYDDVCTGNADEFGEDLLPEASMTSGQYSTLFREGSISVRLMQG